MVCEEWKERLNNLFSHIRHNTKDFNSLPEDIKAHLIICRRCRTAYQASKLLETGTALQKAAPSYLAQRINALIAKESFNLKPVWYRYALLPLAATALIVLSVFVTLLFFTPRNDLVEVRLVFEAANAESVAVVGDWNDWDPHADILSDEDGDGVWEIELHLSPNKEYRYQFYIDGTQWIPDPGSELTVEDGFGGINSVLDI